MEELGRAETPNVRSMFMLAMGVGLMAGLGTLTRYAFGSVMVPVIIFIGLFGGPRRLGLAVASGLTWAVVLTPWIIRNVAVSGTWFGTAGYAFAENTFLYPDSSLMQSINPTLSLAAGIKPYAYKILPNLDTLFHTGIFSLGGGWLGMLFLVGLMLNFRNATAQRLRYFALMSLAVFMFAQALGKTPVSELSPILNTENLLVLLTPLVVIFGTAFFLILLEQLTLPAITVRYGIIALLVLVACQPLIARIMFKTAPISYPPYSPQEIQRVSGWTTPDALIMSDMPWAVAWYGQRQSVWLTLDTQDDFYALHKKIKPVQALYLTSLTMDGKFLSDWMQDGKQGWGNFVYKILKDQRLPDKFPLTKMPEGLFPMRVFLADQDRWSNAAKD